MRSGRRTTAFSIASRSRWRPNLLIAQSRRTGDQAYRNAAVWAHRDLLSRCTKLLSRPTALLYGLQGLHTAIWAYKTAVQANIKAVWGVSWLTYWPGLQDCRPGLQNCCPSLQFCCLGSHNSRLGLQI